MTNDNNERIDALNPEQSAKEMSEWICTILEDRRAEDVSLIPITERSSLADYFILATINSTPHGRTISEHIIEQVQERYQRKPLRTEGLDTVRWILLDYGDVVIHLFHPEERDYYSLEKLWTREVPAPDVE